MKAVRVRRFLRGPASLRSRVVVGVLALVAVLLVALFVAVDLALGARLRSDLSTRLEDRVRLAEQLDGALPAQSLVDRLSGDGVQVQLCGKVSAASSASSVRCVSPHVTPRPKNVGPAPGGRQPPFGQSGRPVKVPAPATTSVPIKRDGSTLFVQTTLPTSRQMLMLSVDSSQVGATIGRLVWFEVIGGLLCLLVAALLLGRVVGRALRPLDQMTSLARNIAGGERGRRLGRARRDTELGRTAAAFDDMLDELESALDRAAAAQTRLREFLGDASHELRSPLAGVQSTAELLLRREPEHREREQAYVALIRETRRASRLVDDLLTVARFDDGGAGGAPRLAIEATDLAEIATSEVERARSRDTHVTLTVGGDPSAPVTGDPMRLGQIVANLLDNARQATPAGGSVHVEVRVDADSCVLDVRDTGPGVADADRERVFERLVRLDVSRSRGTGGFGLGLPIARTLAYAHGGDLTCLPAPVGAHFRLTLPHRWSGGQVVANRPDANRSNAVAARATV